MTPTVTRRCLTIGVVAIGLAQDAGQAGAKKEEDEAGLAERNPALKSRVFELKHRLPDELLHVLKPLGSGVRGTSIASSGALRVITVRDFPENLAAIEEALKRLDTPGAPQPDVEFKMRLLMASPAPGDQVPADLAPVVKQLRATLSYKGYVHVTDVGQRVKAGASSGGKGVASLGPPLVAEPSTVRYSYAVEGVNATRNGGNFIQIRKLRFSVDHKGGLGEADIVTAVSLRDGEKVVVGTASMKERAAILVLTARAVR